MRKPKHVWVVIECTTRVPVKMFARKQRALDFKTGYNINQFDQTYHVEVYKATLAVRPTNK